MATNKLTEGQLTELLEGVPRDAIEGGWTARGLSNYAKSLEADLQEYRQATIKQPSSNSVVGWLRADYQDDNNDLSGGAPLFVLGKKDPSSAWGTDYIPLTGKSPVIPGGWVACSERLPEDTVNSDGGVSCYLVLYADGMQPSGGSRVQVSNVTYLRRWHDGMITHWMELPEPPCEL